jgi:hypothetical protein
MVKNFGGKKGKKISRKRQNISTSKGVRVKSDPDEIYAVVLKLCGGAICEVLCEDKITRLCVIRSKFRGRGKRGNILSPGVLIMVGKRSWEVVSSAKKEKCDLLEVYNDNDTRKLKNDHPGNWEILTEGDPNYSKDVNEGDDEIEWDHGDGINTDILNQLNNEAREKTDNKTAIKNNLEDIIDIDDI